jgi:hypothetical protein
MKDIQDLLKTELGSKVAERIISEILKGVPHDQVEGDFQDMVIDHIDNNGNEEEVLYGLGSCGRFPISIMSCGPMYWVEAQEFDPIKYFKSKEEAISYAESEYAPFIEAMEDDYSSDDNED